MPQRAKEVQFYRHVAVTGSDVDTCRPTSSSMIWVGWWEYWEETCLSGQDSEISNHQRPSGDGNLVV